MRPSVNTSILLALLYISLLCVYVSFFFFLMIRRPPRSTRTDTLFPYTTLFRSYQAAMPAWLGWVAVLLLALYLAAYPALAAWGAWAVQTFVAPAKAGAAAGSQGARPNEIGRASVGKECVSTGRSRWAPYHYKKNTSIQHHKTTISAQTKHK